MCLSRRCKGFNLIIFFCIFQMLRGAGPPLPAACSSQQPGDQPLTHRSSLHSQSPAQSPSPQSAPAAAAACTPTAVCAASTLPPAACCLQQLASNPAPPHMLPAARAHCAKPVPCSLQYGPARSSSPAAQRPTHCPPSAQFTPPQRCPYPVRAASTRLAAAIRREQMAAAWRTFHLPASTLHAPNCCPQPVHCPHPAARLPDIHSR